MQGCHEGSVALSSFSANKNKGLGATKGLTMVRHKGVEGVAVAFAQFIGPQDRGVVEEAATAARLGDLGQASGQVGEFAGEPFVDACKFVDGIFVFVGLVR